MKRKGMLRAILLFLLTVCLAYAQALEPPYPDETPVKINTTLLNIPVVVSDRNGHNLAGLTKEDFVVTKNGQSQDIDFFLNSDEPMNVAIILDASGSTSGVLSRITKAAREFLTVLGPEDKGMIVTFDSNVVVQQELTSDQKKLRRAIGEVFRADQSGSRMDDAVYRVVTQDFLSIKGKKAIVVLTDGDVSGKVTREKLLNELIESDVMVYPIFYYTRRLFPPKTKTISYDDLFKTRPGGYLKSLAVATGGRVYPADGGDFSSAFQNVADEIKKQYVLGVYVDAAEGARDIKVRVKLDGAVTRAKGIIRPKKLSPTLGKNYQ